MRIRFYVDPATGSPHIHGHDVEEHEVEEILNSTAEVRPGRDDTRVTLGRTDAGRALRVIWVPDDDGAFVITAYELRGKPLAAWRRRQRRKGRP